MLYHRAYGRDLDTLVVTVIDNRRPMLSLMRGMLAAIGIGRIETYESPIDAFDAMSRAVPDLVIAASSMQPLTGAAAGQGHASRALRPALRWCPP